MGFFDSVGNVLAAPGKAISSIFGGAPDNLPGMKGLTGNGDSTGMGGGDPLAAARAQYVQSLQAQQKNAENNASDFTKAMPGMEDQAIARAGDYARNQAAGNIQDIRKNYSSRGLLYSGKRAGAEALAGTQAQQNIASQAAQISDQLQQQQQNFNNMAAQAGLNTQAAQAGINASNYNWQLQQALNKRQNVNSLVNGVLGLGGFAGGLMAQPNQQQPQQPQGNIQYGNPVAMSGPSLGQSTAYSSTLA